MLPIDSNRQPPATDAEVRAEYARLQAQTLQLQREIRADKLRALQKELTGKMPGVAVEAVLELAELGDALRCGDPVASEHRLFRAMGSTSFADIFAKRMTEIAAMMPVRYESI